MKTASTANSAQTQQRMQSARPHAGSVRATAPARASTRSPTARSAAPNAADPYATAGPPPQPATGAAVSRASRTAVATAAAAAPETSSWAHVSQVPPAVSASVTTRGARSRPRRIRRERVYAGDLEVAQLSIILTLGCAQSPKAAASFSLTCSLVSARAKSMKHWHLSRGMSRARQSEMPII